MKTFVPSFELTLDELVNGGSMSQTVLITGAATGIGRETAPFRGGGLERGGALPQQQGRLRRWWMS